MHQPSLTPRPSVFFNYEVYPFVAPQGDQSSHKVVIVGAGPIGLAMAIDLARFGVRSVILEAEAQVSHGSRALSLTRRSTEILTQLGVVAPYLAHGMHWSKGDSYFRGQKVYEMVMPSSEDDSCPPAINLAQQYIEKYLVDACVATGMVDLRWQSKLTAIRQSSDQAILTVDTPEGEYELRADWCIAADGGRSTVRSLLNLRMEGSSYEGSFVIIDVKADLDLPPRRQCHFDPSWNPGNNVLIHRQPNGMWRLDYKLPDGEGAEDAVSPAKIKERVNEILRMIDRQVEWELDWATVYRANTLTLPDYKAGRVLFVGDAAHLLPIFGVRGANTGFQDENNLAWKLAYVIQGMAPEKLLSTYSAERVLAAKEICEEGGKSTRFMTPQTAGQRLMRDSVLSLSLSQGFASDLMHWRTSRAHIYATSALNSPSDDKFDGGPGLGEAVRDVALAEGGHLLPKLFAAGAKAGFRLFVYADKDTLASASALLAVARKQSPIVQRVLIMADKAPKDDSGADIVIVDSNGHFAARYDARPGTVYLLRPDMHVCARWRNATGADVSQALNRALCKSEDTP